MDQTLRVMTPTGSIAIPPCPTWCKLPPDHHIPLWLRDDTLEDHQTVDRHHIGAVRTVEATGSGPWAGKVWVEVSQFEAIAAQAADCILTPPAVCIADWELTAVQTRQLAAVLLDMADVLDTVNHGG